MRLPRLTVQAVVSILDKDTGQFAAAAARFAGRFPTAGMTLSLGGLQPLRAHAGTRTLR